MFFVFKGNILDIFIMPQVTFYYNRKNKLFILLFYAVPVLCVRVRVHVYVLLLLILLLLVYLSMQTSNVVFVIGRKRKKKQ